jgi:hypothetical protein
MAVTAKYPLFVNRMFAPEVEISLYLLMALKAHLLCIPRGNDKVSPGMYIMTVRTGNVFHGMSPGVPLMQVESGVCSMAVQAHQRPCRWGEVIDINKRRVIAFCLFALTRFGLHPFWRKVLDRKAAGAMTRLAVNQRHAGLGGELRPHGAGLEVLPYLIVEMASRKAIIHSNVIGIEPTHKEPFVLRYWHYWF